MAPARAAARSARVMLAISTVLVFGTPLLYPANPAKRIKGFVSNVLPTRWLHPRTLVRSWLSTNTLRNVVRESREAEALAICVDDSRSVTQPRRGRAGTAPCHQQAACRAPDAQTCVRARTRGMNDAHLVSPASTSESESSEGQASGRATPVDVAESGPPADAPGSLPTAQHFAVSASAVWTDDVFESPSSPATPSRSASPATAPPVPALAESTPRTRPRVAPPERQTRRGVKIAWPAPRRRWARRLRPHSLGDARGPAPGPRLSPGGLWLRRLRPLH